MERLMAAINADAAATPRRAPLNIAARIAERLMRLRPRTLAWSAVAAVLAIVLQAALLAGLAVQTAEKSRGFESVLVPDKAGSTTGTFVLVSFVPQATTSELTAFLSAHKAAIADGPNTDGYYKIRVAPTKLARDDVAGIVKRMQDADAIVRFAAPTN
jgi:hypothetical protein